MYFTTIYIPDIATARRFVDVMERYPDIHMSIKSDNLEIDPHSIMGVLSLDLNRKLTLQTTDNMPSQLKKELLPFTVEFGMMTIFSIRN